MKPEPGSSGHAQASDKLKGKGVFSWAGVRSRPQARPEEHFSRQTSAGACAVGTGLGALQVTLRVQPFLASWSVLGSWSRRCHSEDTLLKWRQESPSFCLQAVPAQTPCSASPELLPPPQ